MPQKVYLELTQAQFDVLNDCLQSAVAGIGSGGGDFDWGARKEEIASSLAKSFRDRTVARKIRGTLVDLTPTEARAILIAVGNSSSSPDFVKDFLTSAQRKAGARAQLEIQGAARYGERVGGSRT